MPVDYLPSSAALLPRYVVRLEGGDFREWRNSSEILLLNGAALSRFKDIPETKNSTQLKNGAHVSWGAPLLFLFFPPQQANPRCKVLHFFLKKKDFFFFLLH